jgi:hypothetical protein
MVLVAIVTLGYGVWNLPFLPAFVPNDYNRIPPTIYTNAPTNLSPYFSNSTSVEVGLSLLGAELAVGVPIYYQIWVHSQALQPFSKVDAIPDNAMYYNVTSHSIARAFTAIELGSLSGGLTWYGFGYIEYSVAGTFGVTFWFYEGNTIVSRIHSGPLYTVGSQNLIEARYNNALTASLTLFILMFAALEVRIEKHRQNA